METGGNVVDRNTYEKSTLKPLLDKKRFGTGTSFSEAKADDLYAETLKPSGFSARREDKGLCGENTVIPTIH